MTNAMSTAARPQHMNDLPHLILKHIMDRLPLVDLLHRANRVCRKWAEVQQWSRHNRLSLILLIGEADCAEKLITESTFYRDCTHQDGIHNPQMLKCVLAFSMLHISPEKAQPNAVNLSDIFPSITHLQVAISIEEEQGIAILSALLTNLYGNQLTSFKLHSKLYQIDNNRKIMYATLEKMQPILDALEQHPKLTHLTLDLEKCYLDYFENHWLMYINGFLTSSQIPFRLPLLARLREFCFYSSDKIILPMSALLQPYALANLDNLRRLDIHSSSLESLYQERGDDENVGRILSKLTCARFKHSTWYFYSDDYYTLLSKLTSLTGLQLGLELLADEYDAAISREFASTERLFTTLARLTSLANLTLRTYCGRSFRELTLTPSPSLLPQLRSVRTLKLYWFHYSRPSDFLSSLQLPRTFPQLHTLILRCIWWECTVCSPRDIPVKECHHYPELCGHRLEAEMKEIYAQMTWLARLDFKCYGHDAPDAAEEADESDPFLFSHFLFSRTQLL